MINSLLNIEQEEGEMTIVCSLKIKITVKF